MAFKYSFGEIFLNQLQERRRLDQQRDQYIQDMAYKNRQQSLYEKFQMQDFGLAQQRVNQDQSQFEQKLGLDKSQYEEGLGYKENALKQDQSQFNETMNFKEKQLKAETGLGYARLNEQKRLNDMVGNDTPIDFTKIDNMIWKDYYGLQDDDKAGTAEEQKLTWREKAGKEVTGLLKQTGLGQSVVDKIWGIAEIKDGDTPKIKRDKLKNIVSQLSGQLNNSQIQALYRMAEVKTR